MRSIKMGLLSAIVASICCTGPLILIALGLGGLGLGAAISKYHGLFLTAGILLILLSWARYFEEKSRCNVNNCQMKNKKATLVVLIISTTLVLFIVGLNLYTYSGRPLATVLTISDADARTISIPVEGMTCFACEASVSSALEGVDGVVSAKASAKKRVASVNYEPDKTDVRQLVTAINNAGYKASLPR